jgi:hypothetical protein
VNSNGSSSIIVRDTTRCKAMQMVEVSPHHKEA